jgi:cobalt-zinc-cadmium efflux system outer membrane protein
MPSSAQDQEPAAVSVTALVDQVSSNHPELNFYRAELDAAKAGRRGADALTPPELSMQAGHKRVRDSFGVLAGEGMAWSVSLTQTFEWPGRLALRKALANRDVELAELGLARFRSVLASHVRRLAHQLYAAQAKTDALQEVAARFSALKEVFLARDPAGITPLLETRVIEASELVLQHRVAEAEIETRAALIELNQLRGAPLTAPLVIATPELSLADAPSVDALLATAREKNFEFRMREVELAQQGITARLSRHERLPAVSVSPFVSKENAGDRETTIGLGLSVPLPVTGRSRSAVDQSAARLRQAEAAMAMAERDLERSVVTAAQTFQIKLAENRRWSQEAAEKFREAAELADRHYRLGAVPIGTYVEIQNRYLDAVEALLETQGETLQAGLELQQLTGLEFALEKNAP